MADTWTSLGTGIFFLRFRGVKATCFRGQTTRVGITKSGPRVATTRRRDGIVQLFTTDGERNIREDGRCLYLSIYLSLSLFDRRRKLILFTGPVKGEGAKV